MKKLFCLFLICSLLCGCGSTAAVVETAPVETPVPTPEATAFIDELVGKVIISEVMCKNHATITDCNGNFSDWIELQNVSDESLSLKGWSLSCDNGDEWELPDISLESGEFLLIFASGKASYEPQLHADFKLSVGEMLKLSTPLGSISSSVLCYLEENDLSLTYDSGGYVSCKYPTPGFENSSEGYDAWQSTLSPSGPLIINEVSVFSVPGNSTYIYEQYDWIEFKNISDKEIELSDYYISDSKNDYRLCRLPEGTLAPGKTVSFICTEDELLFEKPLPLEFSSNIETIFLSDEEGLVDYICTKGIPLGGSCGRLEGENGLFFFASPSPQRENQQGYCRVSEKPVSQTNDGVFNGVEEIVVELVADGQIFYTLDGSLPDENSALYTDAIKIDRTCVIRAISVEENALPSKALTLSFILNENHSLPVLSLTVDRRTSSMAGGVFGTSKGTESPGSISLFENGESFTIDCGISPTGYQSLLLFKKSMKVTFRNAYENERLNYDVFGTGNSQYSSLALRAGQDNHRAVFRQEIWQDLALEMTDLVPTQHSKFCILYINGEYFGIYCLKEDISRQYFADWSGGVSKDSVESVKVPDTMTDDFKASIFAYCRNNDMSQKEHYQYICNVIDINSFIDWVILQGVCCNVDLFRNVRFFRSFETDGLWKSVLFDLDHAMLDDYGSAFTLGYTLPGDDWPFSSVMGDSAFSNSRMSELLINLLKNDEFRSALLRRYGEVYDTVLSNENILAKIDYYEALLEPEIQRDWEHWYANPENWDVYVDMLRRCVTELDWQNYVKEALFRYLDVTEEEINLYFK